ncbi:hypothetical protein KI387_035383, partial [Taxus chinensis]
VGFILRRAQPRTLDNSQEYAIEVGYDMILFGKLKNPNGKRKGQTSKEGVIDSLIQKLANDVISLKKQLAQATFPREGYPNQNQNHSKNGIDGGERRLSFEAPHVNVTCEARPKEDFDEAEFDENNEGILAIDEIDSARNIGFCEYTPSFDDEDDETIADMNSHSY